jgi:CRISPR/Cas system Type II protein with McrA/HNH and RuvC-like nuclease domain
MAYTKVFASILKSTVWLEDSDTRVVWITMLAMADKYGEVSASVPGLAHMANVSIEACRSALARFEGREIEKIDGGWEIINFEKYARLIFKTDGRLPQDQWVALRTRIFERDAFTCTYCGASDRQLECDHIRPVSRGGTNDEDNLTTACGPCNRSKKDKTPSEWRRQ